MFKDGYLIPNLDNIPAEMKEYRQWVFWKAVKFDTADKKAAKIPMRTCKAAKSNKPETWLPWEMMQHWERLGMNGVEFMLHRKLDPFTMIDIDSCVANWQLNELALKVMDYFDSYSEFSPSGGGLRIIVKGKIDSSIKHPKKNGTIIPVEIYSHRRPTSMTGMACNEKNIMERQDKLDRIYSRHKVEPNINRFFDGRKANGKFIMPRETFPDGTRNNNLAKWAGVILNKVGRDESSYWGHLAEVNLRCCNPPVSERELRSIGQSIWRLYHAA